MIDSLTRLAAEQQRQFDATTSPLRRKERGHFGTTPAIADFMVGMFPQIPQGPVRILDPGAGVGTLSAAVCQRIVQRRDRHHLVFELWENDLHLAERLGKTMEACQQTLRDTGHEMEFTIQTKDFVLEHAHPSLFGTAPAALFHLAIMNPPYFKVRKDSASARAMAHIVHGQPNIYAFFMAIAANLLVEGGEMVAITPRSYFNGLYFKRFRKWFFDKMTARQIHVFESRTEVFQEDEVLQENVILLAEKGGKQRDVILTSSLGRNFQQVNRHAQPYKSVIEDLSGDHLVRVTTSAFEQQIVEALDSLQHRFRDLPFKISTGPVVAFRSRDFLRYERSVDTAPLLWMHNVRPFTIKFPAKNGKPMHILVSDESDRLLLPAKRYVLLKRFTAKEERKRLVAGIVEAKDLYSSFVGLENHLNYVHNPNGELSKEESLGLATLFNSVLVDRYFRAISGNTQVNAAEIRAMPLPCVETIRELGRTVERNNDAKSMPVERMVCEAFGLSKKLSMKVCEASQ